MESIQEPFSRVAILGLGLMGASLGMALRAAGVARSVAGYDASEGVAERARERGAIDIACATIPQAIAAADLVALAAPIRAAPDLFATITPHLAPGALVTDLCSVKAHLVACAERAMLDPSRFVGGHPMTGGEQSGVEAARADLYAGCVWPLTPTERTAPGAITRISWMVDRLGATPVLLDPSEHDAAIAPISHLPRVAASALVLAAAQDASWPVAQRLAAGGFRDTTRVVSGSPGMSLDICLTNAPALLTGLDAYIELLRALRERIARGDVTLEETFTSAKRIRDDMASAPQLDL
jgi:prephenate dehydrogenase